MNKLLIKRVGYNAIKTIMRKIQKVHNNYSALIQVGIQNKNLQIKN